MLRTAAVLANMCADTVELARRRRCAMQYTRYLTEQLAGMLADSRKRTLELINDLDDE